MIVFAEDLFLTGIWVETRHALSTRKEIILQ